MNVTYKDSYIVLPDLHLKHEIADKILEKERGNYKKIIWLGDFFDAFYDTPEQNADTAKWLKNKLLDKNNVFCFGNHCVNYTYDSTFTWCSGFSQWKKQAIQKVWDTIPDFRPEKYFRLFYYDYDRNILFTHAGLSNSFLKWKNPEAKTSQDIIHWLLKEELKVIKDLKEDKYNDFVGAGRARGGFQQYGGLTWSDFRSEFVPVQQITQIFGHTPGREVRIKDGNYCLDTWASGLYSYILIDQEIQIKNL